MAVARKYGRVLMERGLIPEDEPVFVLRARDENATDALHAYRAVGDATGCSAEHLAGVDAEIERFRQWQACHPTKKPD